MTPTLCRAARGAVLSALIAAGTVAAVAAPQKSSALLPHAKTVVLVHGYFSDGSAWSEVIRILQAAGVNVVAVQNPLSSLDADIDATRLVIDEQDGPVVLVGHSFGGMVISVAGTDPKVASLVYVCAFAPSPGDSVGSLVAALPPAPWMADLVSDSMNDLKLNQQGVLQYFVPDLPVWRGKVISATQGAFAMATLGEPAIAAAWQTKPSWYLQAKEDQIIDPGLELEMAEKIGARTLSIHSGHAMMLSHPEVVAGVILEAALHP